MGELFCGVSKVFLREVVNELTKRGHIPERIGICDNDIELPNGITIADLILYGCPYDDWKKFNESLVYVEMAVAEKLDYFDLDYPYKRIINSAGGPHNADYSDDEQEIIEWDKLKKMIAL